MQLGLGIGVNVNVPTLVSGVTGAAQVAIGGLHTCVLLASGGVRCFGYNFFGQLGDGTTTSKLSPTSGIGSCKLCGHAILLWHRSPRCVCCGVILDSEAFSFLFCFCFVFVLYCFCLRVH